MHDDTQAGVSGATAASKLCHDISHTRTRGRREQGNFTKVSNQSVTARSEPADSPQVAMYDETEGGGRTQQEVFFFLKKKSLNS